jgi:hypothetical protein
VQGFDLIIRPDQAIFFNPKSSRPFKTPQPWSLSKTPRRCRSCQPLRSRKTHPAPGIPRCLPQGAVQRTSAFTGGRPCNSTNFSSRRSPTESSLKQMRKQPLMEMFWVTACKGSGPLFCRTNTFSLRLWRLQSLRVTGWKVRHSWSMNRLMLMRWLEPGPVMECTSHYLTWHSTGSDFTLPGRSQG